MTVPFTLTVPADATPGDHAGGLVASIETPGTDPDGSAVTVDTRFGLPAYVQVAGPLTPGADRRPRREPLPPLGGRPRLGRARRDAGRCATRQRAPRRPPGRLGAGPVRLDHHDAGRRRRPELLPGSSVSYSAHLTGVLPTFRVTGVVTVDPFSRAGQISTPPRSRATDRRRCGPSRGSAGWWRGDPWRAWCVRRRPRRRPPSAGEPGRWPAGDPGAPGRWSGRRPEPDPDRPDRVSGHDTSIPEGFRWGTATAAHQVEGNNVNNDWWEWEHRPDTVCVEPSGDCCDHYHRYPDDIALLAALGFDNYRFSIEWSRIEPEEGRFSRAALDHYRRMCATCHEHGLDAGRHVPPLHHAAVGDRPTAGWPDDDRRPLHPLLRAGRRRTSAT